MISYEVQGGFDRTAGSHLQGHITALYSTLVAMFGEPMQGDGYKTQAEWVVEFYDEEADEYVITTIYDWKQYDRKPQQVIDWNVGGFKSSAVTLLNKAIEDYHAEYYLKHIKGVRTDYDEAPDYDNTPLTPDSINRAYADSVGMSVRWR
jgi:hypothetical protein